MSQKAKSHLLICIGHDSGLGDVYYECQPRGTSGWVKPLILCGVLDARASNPERFPPLSPHQQSVTQVMRFLESTFKKSR